MHRAFAVVMVNLLATWLMVGLIWTIQLVHYPAFALIGPAHWSAYHTRHLKMITVIIAPTMFVEAVSAAVLVFVARSFLPRARLCVWIAGILVLVNWISTAAVQVPLHNQLAEHYDLAMVDRLVLTNWLRTIAWSARGGLMAYVTWSFWKQTVGAVPLDFSSVAVRT